MGLSLDRSDIKVISRLDSSLDKSDPEFTEKYNNYLMTLDEDLLPKIPGVEPSRFVLRRVLEYKIAAKIKNDQIKLRKDGNKLNKNSFDIDMNVGSVSMEDIRAALIDIEHPPGVEPGSLVMKKDVSGLACFDLIALLDTYGIVSDLYAARQHITSSTPTDAKKK